MIDLKQLMVAFPKWSITGDGLKEFKMISRTNDNRNEVSQIMDFLKPVLSNEKWSLEVNGFRLIFRLKELRKYSRMYTSGCFDIFHYGHLNILKQSKELCDYLIVGVSTDELIEKEKGRRPVIPFKERIRVVQAVGLVDEVIPQEDKNKQNIVETYNIDAISVGDDWRGRYPKVSCQMEYFPYTTNVSSTILKDALKLTEKKS